MKLGHHDEASTLSQRRVQTTTTETAAAALEREKERERERERETAGSHARHGRFLFRKKSVFNVLCWEKEKNSGCPTRPSLLSEFPPFGSRVGPFLFWEPSTAYSNSFEHRLQPVWLSLYISLSLSLSFLHPYWTQSERRSCVHASYRRRR